LVTLLRNQAPNPNRENPVLQAIEASGVLKQWPDAFEELQQVDPQALAGLGAEDFLNLRDNNALPVLYAQLMSMPRLNRIKNFAQRKQKMVENQNPEPDINQLFGNQDVISFDNM